MRKPRWKRLRRRGNGSAPPAGLLSAAETLLRERERFCVSACSRYLNNERADRLWVFPAPVSGSRVKPAPRPAALLLYAKQSLYPICCGRFFQQRGFFRTALNGVRRVEVEQAVEKVGNRDVPAAALNWVEGLFRVQQQRRGLRRGLNAGTGNGRRKNPKTVGALIV